LQTGTTIGPHAIAGGATMHVLEGRLRMHPADTAEEVGVGDVVVLSENLRRPVVGLEHATALAVVAWPEEAGAGAMEAANGHVWRSRTWNTRPHAMIPETFEPTQTRGTQYRIPLAQLSELGSGLALLSHGWPRRSSSCVVYARRAFQLFETLGMTIPFHLSIA
jgi:hypothetical protein